MISPVTATTVDSVQIALTGCSLTFDYDLASLYQLPSPSAATIGRITSGTYVFGEKELVDWGGGSDWWYEITVNGTSGWVDLQSLLGDDSTWWPARGLAPLDTS
jgi:hypothetical protein